MTSHRARAHRPQDCELAPTLVEARPNGDNHTTETDHHDHSRDEQQRIFDDADDAPELVQRNTRQHGHERLAGIVVDRALHLENACAGLEPDERCGDFLGCEIELPRELRRDRQSGNAHPALPVEMNRLHRLEAHVDAAIDRRARARQYADDGERLVGVLGAKFSGAVAQRNRSPTLYFIRSATSAPSTVSNRPSKRRPAASLSGCDSP